MATRSMRVRRLSNTAIGFVAFVGILIAVALIGQRHPLRVDLSESRRYTLSDQSKKILAGLKGDISIKAFFQEAGRNREKTQDLLETYRYHSRNIRYEFIDPDRHPTVAKQYQIRSYGTLVLEGFGKTQTVTTTDEQSITNAIVKLSQEGEKVVYFLTGHGERDTTDVGKDGYAAAKTAIEKENFKVKFLNLLVEARVPQDAALVVIAGPQKPLLANEIALLRQHVQHGGRIMILLEPFADGGLQGILKSHGFLLAADIIIDPMSRVFGASLLMPVITQYGSHKITEGFTVACIFPTARSVNAEEKSPPGITVTELAFTSPSSWAETGYQADSTKELKFDERKDRKGPVPVAAIAAIAVEKGSTEAQEEGSSGKGPSRGEAHLAVFGDCDFASNTYFNLQGNGDFFLNTISFLGQQEDLITIQRPKSGTALLTLSRSQERILFWIGLLLMPLVVLAAGIAVFQARRKYR
jgi:gliding motility-associatede transport system auxiliary component